MQRSERNDTPFTSGSKVREEREQPVNEQSTAEYLFAGLAVVVIVMSLAALLGLFPGQTERLLLLGTGAVMNIGAGVLALIQGRNISVIMASVSLVLVTICLVLTLLMSA